MARPPANAPSLDYSSSKSFMLTLWKKNRWIRLKRKRNAIIIAGVCLTQRTTIENRSPNRTDIDYSAVVKKIMKLKTKNPRLFTRMYRLSPTSFDRVLSIIDPSLRPMGVGGKNIIPPIIKMCLGIRLLAGGSYLDLSFAYEVSHNHVHHYAWEAIAAMDSSVDSFINNIQFPIDDRAKLEQLAVGFARLGGGTTESLERKLGLCL